MYKNGGKSGVNTGQIQYKDNGKETEIKIFWWVCGRMLRSCKYHLKNHHRHTVLSGLMQIAS
jgi:hypothetical protein